MSDRAPHVPLTIDGRPAPESGTLLDACAALGVEVPAFCRSERLSAGGSCRSCLVERDGRWVPACHTAAAAGGRVRTTSPLLEEYRRDLGELVRSEATPGGEVDAWLTRWGVTGERYGARATPAPHDASHPFLRFDPSRCILCRRCVRACEEIEGRFVWSVEGRGASTRLAFGAARLADSACAGCGACVAECPTGALSSVDRERDESAARRVRTTCGYCGVGCQLDVWASADRIVHIEGTAAAAVNRGHLCIKGRYAHAWVSHPDRLTRPLVRRHGRLEPVAWSEAIEEIVRGLTRLDGRVAGLSSSRATNEENYLFQKWLRGGLGTNDVDCCARVCHAPSAAGMRESFGTGAATGSFADIELADLLCVTGSNATEAHPVVGARIAQAALRGAALVVIDPRRTELAALADVHLAPRPGTNVPLLNALAAELLALGAVDRAFIANRTEGWEDYAAFVRPLDAAATEAITGVPAARVSAAAARLAVAARPLFLHGLGVTEHLQGSEAVRLIANLALMRGAVGRPGAGVNPLRGQNNVQGAADMGCQPDRLPGYARVDDDAERARIERVWGRPIPRRPGRTLPHLWDAIRAGDLRGLLIFGEDVAQTDPEAERVRAALESLDLLVVQELFLTETAKLAHVVLPAAGVFEKDGTFTNGERRIQRVRRVVPPPGEAKPDWEILRDLMTATGWPQTYRSPGEILEEIARVIPDFTGVTEARLEPDGLQWPVPAAGHPGTPTLHAQTFANGRARFACVEFVPSPELGGALTLMTGRLLEHYNSGSMTRRTGSRERVGADRIELNPVDAAARGLAAGDRVWVRSRHGETELLLGITERVPPGAAFATFHFPESGINRLIGPVRDRTTDCPEYKVTAVEIGRVRADGAPPKETVVTGREA